MNEHKRSVGVVQQAVFYSLGKWAISRPTLHKEWSNWMNDIHSTGYFNSGTIIAH